MISNNTSTPVSGPVTAGTGDSRQPQARHQGNDRDASALFGERRVTTFYTRQEGQERVDTKRQMKRTEYIREDFQSQSPKTPAPSSANDLTQRVPDPACEPRDPDDLICPSGRTPLYVLAGLDID